MTKKELRIVMSLVGVILTGISVGIFQFTALGTDPFTCLVVGIAKIFDSTYSTWYVIITTVLLAGVFVLQRRYIGIATIINLFGVGFTADWTRAFLENLINSPSMTFRIIFLVLNVILLSVAASLYFTANLGVSAYDAVALIATHKYKLAQFKMCRVCSDLFCVTVGWINAADIGIGTVITAFMMGPIVQFFNERLSEPLLRSRRKVRHFR